MIFFVLFYAIPNWFVTGIVASLDRFLLLMLCFIVLCIYIHSLAYFVGTVFIDSENASLYFISLGSIPMVMICERIDLNLDTSNLFLTAFSALSFQKYIFRAMMIALYGNSRCDDRFKSSFINYTLDMKEWIDLNLDVKKLDGTNYTGSEVSEQFGNRLVKLINGEYFNKNNTENPFEFRSLILNRLEFGDFNLFNQLFILLFEALMLRILSISIIYYLFKKRVF